MQKSRTHPSVPNDRLLLGLNRPDSYNTFYSTSRGSVNRHQISHGQQLRMNLVSHGRDRRHPHADVTDDRGLAAALDESRSRSVNLLGILLGY